MQPTISQRPLGRSPRAPRLRMTLGSQPRRYSIVIVVLFAATLLGFSAAEEITPLPPSGDSSCSHSTVDVRTVKMTEEEFDAFMQRRAGLREIYGLRTETCISAIKNEKRRDQAVPFLYVELPDRRVAFTSRQVIIRLYRDDATRLLEALPYFPETNLVSVWHDEETSEVYWRPRPYETTPIPGWLLEGLRKLPHLDALYFQGGSFDREAMATIAEYPSLRDLSLGRCRVTPEDFSQLAKLKTLESFSVIAGVGPECFVTLAKLPRFRDFYLQGASTDEFNVPIDETTRLAIESLNGRLEKFSTSYEETPDVTVHASVVRALLKVKSLRVLRVEFIGKGLTLRDFEKLKEFHELICLDMDFGWSRSEMTEEEFIKARSLVGMLEKAAHERAEKERREKASE